MDNQQNPQGQVPQPMPAQSPAVAPVAPQTATVPAPVAATTATVGPNGPLPEELKGWNWGAFLMTWIWAIGNQTYIGLLALISPISLIMAIVLGIKGNEWAWQNRKFESVDQFKKVQKAWAVWGIVILVLTAVLGIIAAITLIGLSGARESAVQAQGSAI